MGDKIKHLYTGTTYELVTNSFSVEAETYEEAKELVTDEDKRVNFGMGELQDLMVQIEEIKDAE